MSILKVARLGHPVLRNAAADLTQQEIKSPEIQRLINNMVETMKEYDGVGLAAVQVHVPKQIAVLEVANNPRYPHKPEVPLSVIINPKMEPLSETMEEDWEGCLSILEMRGKVPRYTEVKVTGFNQDGEKLDFVAEGFHARVIQHEWDHLHGKVFLDRMKDLSTLTYLPEFSRYWVNR